MRRIISILTCSLLLTTTTYAQLSQNPDKFLGNITTGNSQMDVSGVPKYYTLWNQVTPENASKWQSVEGTRGSYSWWGADNAYNYAKDHKFPFKFHTLVWGSQYPNWFTSSLSVQDRYNAIVKWMDAVKSHYPDLTMIDVVNEAVGMHQQGNPLMKESLGGGGRTGYDWLIKAFELAHERWPNAILIYNDFNTFQWDTDAYIDLVRTLRDAGAPIDAYGCQSHDVDNISYDNLKNSMTRIQNAVKLPMYITELDINIENDTLQRTQFQNIFPLMWEADYCAGVTLWGYIYGSTWVDHSGLYKNNSERLAMTWLKQYMATEKAKTAKSPFPGMKKQISLYIKPSKLKATRGDTLDITVRAQLVDDKRSIDSVKLFINGKLDTVMTEAPYIDKYVPASNGKYTLKAIVYADSVQYEREGSFTAYNPRAIYGKQPIAIPGTLQAEEYDKGGDGVTYHDNDANNQGDASFRTSEGVDVVNGNGGNAIGYTGTDEWLEYTVNVTQAGYYTYEAVASSGTTGSGFRLELSDVDGITKLTDNISVPQTASNDWSVYKTLTGRTLIPLKEGDQIIRLTITGSNCNVDKITLKHVEVDKTLNVRISANPSPATVSETTTLKFTPVTASRDSAIASVKVYINGSLTSTVKTRPFQYNYKPTAKGTVTVSAIAVDTLGHESEITKLSLTVNNKRTPYKTINLPGTLEIENFDKGGEGVSFHDSDSNDEGKANYRSDNEGADIVTGNGGYAIGYTASGEWLEYTVNIKKTGSYGYKATVSSGNNNSGFRIGLMKNGSETVLANVSVPNNGSWDTYQTTTTEIISGRLYEGQQTIRITITGAYCNIDKIEFKCLVEDGVKYVTDQDMRTLGPIYNMGGVRVNEYKDGINIMNGKKVLILE